MHWINKMNWRKQLRFSLTPDFNEVLARGASAKSFNGLTG